MATLSDKDKIEKLKEEKKAQKREIQCMLKRLNTREKKCERQKQEILRQRSELKTAQTAIKALERKYQHFGVIEECPKGHSYSLWQIQAAVNMQVYCGQSYRQVRYSLRVIMLIMGLYLRVPCVNTIRQWVQKFGKSELERGKENEAQKIIIMDESIGSRGQEKVLLFLGILSENWVENPRDLKHEDAMAVGIKTEKSWTGKKISEQLKKIKGGVEYVVSDGCSSLKSACKLSGLVHVLDCTHFMGNFMKKHHEKQEGYEKLLSGMSKIRQQWGQSAYAALITPNMRTKAKFLNLFAIAEWLEKILNGFSKMTVSEQERVNFVVDLSEYANELICMVKIVKELSVILKSQGITIETEQHIRAIFSSRANQYAVLPKMEQSMLEYVRNIRASLPEKTSIMCCSDLIESYFGKFKNRNEKSASQGITQDVLSIPLFAEQRDLEKVKQAMESTSWADINKWAEENLVQHFGKTKRNFWEKVLPKIA